MILIFANIASYCTYIHPSWSLLTLIILKESILEVEVTEVYSALHIDGTDDDDDYDSSSVTSSIHILLCALLHNVY